MTKIDREEHWEHVYFTKNPEQVSWTQDFPKTSLELIRAVNPNKNAEIIDIGGGDSRLVDYLLAEGYENIAVLDISEKALEKAQKRLGEEAKKVTWIVSDVTKFKPKKQYDVWHDRAAFHFLTDEVDVHSYLQLVNKAVKDHLILATFSDDGPKKCSGLPIHQYNENSISNTFKNTFERLNCFTEDHTTPFETKQNFIFCTFKRKNLN